MSASQPPKEVPESVTLQRAARVLGCHYNTAYKLARTGRLKAYRVGRVYRVAVADLRAYREKYQVFRG